MVNHTFYQEISAKSSSFFLLLSMKKQPLTREQLHKLVYDIYHHSPEKKFTFITGAGLSADSGIPTYRGIDGIWVKGTKYHKPTEFGTFEFFLTHPVEVWIFNSFRKWMFGRSKPNVGHDAIAQMEKLLGDRFFLITQNIDRLHQKSGVDPLKMVEMHGNLDYMRCASECSEDKYPFPLDLPYDREPFDESLVEQNWEKFEYPKCQSTTRPNILWFDEYYDEQNYRMDTCKKIAAETGLLFIIGTSGSTGGAHSVLSVAYSSGAHFVEINLDAGRFTQEAMEARRGHYITGSTSAILPMLKEIFEECVRGEIAH